MPSITVKLIPGVNVEKTPVLNEAGISISNLIRFRDGLVEKIGGWVKFYNFVVGGIVRCLHAWQALNSDKFLGVGSTTNLSVIKDGVLTNITPQQYTSNVNPNFSTTASSSTVVIVDSNLTSSTTTYDSVFFATPVSVGGLILSGLYPIASVAGTTTYRITAQANAATTRENLAISNITQANPGVVTYVGADDIANTNLVYIFGVGGMTQVNGGIYAVAGLNSGANTFQLGTTNTTGFTAYTSGGTVSPAAVPKFTTASGSPAVTVTFQAHGLVSGDSFTFPISTTVGGVTISGTYPVTSVTDANNFVITVSSAATSSTSAFMNSGQVRIIYYITLGPTSAFSGYSIGTYSSGGYSTGTSLAVLTGTPITSSDWTLDNWGEDLIAVPDGGAIYYWQPNRGFLNAQLVSTGPLFNTGAFVSMQTQMLICYGSTQVDEVGSHQDPLLVKWSDIGDFTSFVTSTTSQAGSRRLPTGSKIVGGLSASQQELLWTDIDLWAMSYLGSLAAGVWGFTKIGDNCGLIAKHAAVRLGPNVYWMGASNFFTGTGQPIPCTVWDKVFQNLNTSFKQNIQAFGNTPFNEAWWEYPSSASVTGENDSYAKVNTLTGWWDYGPLPRSTGIDSSVLGNPIYADPTTGYLYQHEEGYDADGSPINSFFESGWFTLSDGEIFSFVDWIRPDMKWQTADGSTTGASLQITIYTADYAGDTPLAHGPYTMTQATRFINTRARGRFAKIRVSSGDLGSFWRIGGIEIRTAPDGRR